MVMFSKGKKKKKTQRFKTFSSFNHIWTSNFCKWESFVILFASSRHAMLKWLLLFYCLWPIENLYIGFYLLAEARRIWSFNNSSINPLAIFLFLFLFYFWCLLERKRIRSFMTLKWGLYLELGVGVRVRVRFSLG